MPILTKTSLSLQEHIWPLLSALDLAPRWDNPDDGWHEGIYTKLGYVSTCNHGDLYVEGDQQLADYLLKNLQPFGKELTIHFYPKKVIKGPSRFVNFLNVMMDGGLYS